MFDFGVYILVALRWFMMVLVAIAYLIGMTIYMIIVTPLRRLGLWVRTKIDTSVSSIN